MDALQKGSLVVVFESLYHYRERRKRERAHGLVNGAMDQGRASGTGTREGAWTAKTKFRVGCTSLAHGSAVLGCCTLVNHLKMHQLPSPVLVIVVQDARS
jgi:hypothetical protein